MGKQTRFRRPTSKMNAFIKRKKLFLLAKSLSSEHRWDLQEICMWCDDLNGHHCSCNTAPWLLPESISVDETVESHFTWIISGSHSLRIISCPVDQMETFIPNLNQGLDINREFIQALKEEEEMSLDLNVKIEEEEEDYFCPDLNVKIEAF